MAPHPPFTVLFVIEDECSLPKSFMAYLQSMPHLKFSVARQLPAEVSNYDVVVTRNLQNEGAEHLGQFVENGGSWLILVHLSEKPLPVIFGVQPEPVGPAAELRILFENKNHFLALRLPDAVYLPGRYHALKKIDEACETILYADWHYQHKPVLTHRWFGKGQAACTTLQAYENPIFQQILYRLMRRLVLPVPDRRCFFERRGIGRQDPWRCGDVAGIVKEGCFLLLTPQRGASSNERTGCPSPKSSGI